MTQETAVKPRPEAAPDATALALRPSTELQSVPLARAPAPPKAARSDSTAPAPAALPPLALGSLENITMPAAMALPRQLVAAPPPEITWSLASLALAAGVGWLYERRRRVGLEAKELPKPWHSSSASQLLRSAPGVDETFPEDGEIAEPDRPVYVSVIGATPSRREATLVDLHDLNMRLTTLRQKPYAAVELLELHLVDFRYTSPWVFLELRELYEQLDQRDEWELVREAFRTRFAQNAPQWNAPSTAGAELANDRQLIGDLGPKWPQRDARQYIVRWMLGDAQSRAQSRGPPQLALGIYRDMLLLDALLDEVMAAGAAPPILVTHF